MASLGKFSYYTTSAPASDSGFAYPIMQAPSDKAIKITSLSLFNLTNTTACGILYAILPSKTAQLSDGTFEIATSVSFPLGLLATNTLNTSIINPSTSVANIRITAYQEIIVPPSALLVAYPDPNGNLNGTVQYQAIGYECEVDGY